MALSPLSAVALSGHCTCCHICKTSLKRSNRDFLPCSTCNSIVCHQCLGDDWLRIQDPSSWSCPRCQGNCPCKRCRKRGSSSTGAVPPTKAYSDLSRNRRRNSSTMSEDSDMGDDSETSIETKRSRNEYLRSAADTAHGREGDSTSSSPSYSPPGSPKTLLALTAHAINSDADGARAHSVLTGDSPHAAYAYIAEEIQRGATLGSLLPSKPASDLEAVYEKARKQRIEELVARNKRCVEMTRQTQRLLELLKQEQNNIAKQLSTYMNAASSSSSDSIIHATDAPSRPVLGATIKESAEVDPTAA